MPEQPILVVQAQPLHLFCCLRCFVENSYPSNIHEGITKVNSFLLQPAKNSVSLIYGISSAFKYGLSILKLYYPWRCLCFGFSQITLIEPFLLMILHFSQIGFTDALTFIYNLSFQKRLDYDSIASGFPKCKHFLFISPNDSSFC